MSKTQLNRIQELEERVEIMDKIFEENQEKMRMMTDMMSLMRQHMELMNTHIVKIAQQENKIEPKPAPVVVEPVSSSTMDVSEEQEKPMDKKDIPTKQVTSQVMQMRRVM